MRFILSDYMGSELGTNGVFWRADARTHPRPLPEKGGENKKVIRTRLTLLRGHGSSDRRPNLFRTRIAAQCQPAVDLQILAGHETLVA
jgi:hypothetical protein